MFLLGIGHTLKALLFPVDFGHKANVVLASMKSVSFNCPGTTCTWFHLYFGFGLTAAIFFFFSGYVMWFIGGLPPRRRAGCAPIREALFVSYTALAVVSWAYLFLIPLGFSIAIAALLGAASLREQPTDSID